MLTVLTMLTMLTVLTVLTVTMKIIIYDMRCHDSFRHRHDTTVGMLNLRIMTGLLFLIVINFFFFF